MLRPLFVTGSLAHGGAERHSITLMNQLAARGHDCHGVYIKNRRDQIDRVQLGPTGSMYCPNARRYLDGGALDALTQHLRRLQPGVIVAANAYALTYASLARWRAGLKTPVVVTFHSTRLLDLKEHLKMAFERLFFSTADLLVFVCEAQRRYWQRRALLARRYAVVHNGVDVDHFHPGPFREQAAALRRSYGLAVGDYVVGMAAVLRPEKNPVQLVDAVGALRRQGIPAKALFIGDGEMRPEIEARARALDITGHVLITGLRQEVRPELAACDVLTLCSVTEALSLAALEAMAMGLPVVHSDVGGARELITPGHNGFVFTRGDLAGFVRHLAFLADRRLSRQLGSHARRVAEEHFSLAGMVDRYEQLLLELCNSGAALGRSQAPAAPGGYGYVVMKQDYSRSKDL